MGRLRLDVNERRLEGNGQRLGLKPKVFDTLVCLTRSANRLVTRERLLAEVWDGVCVSDGALTQSIWQLRRALAASGENVRIETVARAGYRLLGDVRSEPLVRRLACTRWQPAEPAKQGARQSLRLDVRLATEAGEILESLELSVAEDVVRSLLALSERLQRARATMSPHREAAPLRFAGRKTS